MDHSAYLDLPLLPVAVALPRMLAKIEGELATAGPQEKRRLEQRARMIDELLAPRPVTLTPPRIAPRTPAQVGCFGAGGLAGGDSHIVAPICPPYFGSSGRRSASRGKDFDGRRTRQAEKARVLETCG